MVISKHTKFWGIHIEDVGGVLCTNGWWNIQKEQ